LLFVFVDVTPLGAVSATNALQNALLLLEHAVLSYLWMFAVGSFCCER